MTIPAVGSFYNTKAFGFPWSQPGPGDEVSPQAPTEYPIVFQGFPQAPFSYTALYNLICGHWVNMVECFEEFDSVTQMQAAVLVCPVCGVVQLIVEPYSEWENNYFGLYPLGLGSETFPDD